MKNIITVPEIISIAISCIALVVSLLTFLLPLIKNHFLIEEPTSVYTVSRKENQYDELIIPVICNNYGNFIHSINKIECTLNCGDKVIPMRPFCVYDNIYETDLSIGKNPYSTFTIEQNSGILKYVGFKYDDTSFSAKDKISSEFHFTQNTLYIAKVTFYSTRNSFFKADREVIQTIYGFETKDEVFSDSIFESSKQSWFKITARNIHPAYK